MIRRQAKRLFAILCAFILHAIFFYVACKLPVGEHKTRTNAQPYPATMVVGLGKIQTSNNLPMGTKHEQTLPGSIRHVQVRKQDGEIGITIPKAELSTSSKDIDDENLSAYLPTRDLERKALIISEPDQKIVGQLPNSATSVILRIFIDSKGKVREISVLNASPEISSAYIQALKSMFYATGYIPGRLRGKDVPSYIDLEISSDQS